MKRTISAQMAKRGSEKELAFDREFWNRMDPEKKLVAAWEMIQQVALIRGEKDAGQSRLQRSVQNIERRER